MVMVILTMVTVIHIMDMEVTTIITLITLIMAIGYPPYYGGTIPTMVTEEVIIHLKAMIMWHMAEGTGQALHPQDGTATWVQPDQQEGIHIFLQEELQELPAEKHLLQVRAISADQRRTTASGVNTPERQLVRLTENRFRISQEQKVQILPM